MTSMYDSFTWQLNASVLVVKALCPWSVPLQLHFWFLHSDGCVEGGQVHTPSAIKELLVHFRLAASLEHCGPLSQ
eukprot:5021852-Amphidinium_carterae.2